MASLSSALDAFDLPTRGLEAIVGVFGRDPRGQAMHLALICSSGSAWCLGGFPAESVRTEGVVANFRQQGGLAYQQLRLVNYHELPLSTNKYMSDPLLGLFWHSFQQESDRNRPVHLPQTPNYIPSSRVRCFGTCGHADGRTAAPSFVRNTWGGPWDTRSPAS